MKGFTLLELLLSVALLGALAGLSLPVYRTLISKNDLDIAADTVAMSLRRAQLLSQAVSGDSAWGVKVQNGSVTLFKGAAYAGRDADFDETFTVPPTIGVSGTSEIVFTKFTGYVPTTGTINLSAESDEQSVAINEQGTVGF